MAIGFQRRFAEMLGVEPERLELDHVGLNHLTWERAARVDGVDRLPELLAAHVGEIAGVARAAAVPAARRWASCRRTTCATSTPTTRWSASSWPARRAPPRWPRSSAGCCELYADPALDEKPELLAQRGGAFYSEAAVQLAAALLGDGPAPRRTW